MDSAVIAHRIHFAVLIMYHYLFPALTMGLSIMIAVFKTFHYRTHDEKYGEAVRFWSKIFVLNFGAGVATGVPMEFQFGTNWARFSAIAGGVIGPGLMMEGIFAFFLESFFLGVLILGEKKVPPFVHWLSAVILAFGTCLSGYFITATDAFMQNPVPGSYSIGADDKFVLTNPIAYFFNPYETWMFWHTIFGSIVTSALVVGAVGAFYLLTNRFRDHALIYVKHSIVIGLIFSLLIGFTGSKNGEQVTRVNPAKLAAMEGTFKTEPGAPLALYGIPDTQKGELLDGIEVPGLLSYLAYGNAQAPVKGLNDIPKADRPPVEVTYYAYHVMITIGMLLVLIYIVGALLLLGGVLERSRWFLLLLLLAFPIGYIGDETGWVVAEVGRQPWLINNVLRTAQGTSTNVPQGETIFTLIGFVAIYGLLSVLFLSIIGKMIANGPAPKIAKAQTSKEGAE